MGQATKKQTGRRALSSRSAVRRVLRERGLSAEEVLIALVDVIVDSHVDHELRERGLGPDYFHHDPNAGPVDVLHELGDAIYSAERVYGKGFGRQPARGTVEDAAREISAIMRGTFDRTLPPVRRALRQVLSIGYSAAEKHLNRVDPPDGE